MKTLHLLRHAKSDWPDSSIDDFERPLNRRGKRARKVIARHVAGWHVDLVVCSPALRATATAKPIVKVLACPVRYDDGMYAAGADDLFAMVQHLGEDTSSVMFVGHNPSLEELTAMICAESPRYPTGALATLELDVGRWSDVTPGCGSLTALVTPSQLADEQNEQNEQNEEIGPPTLRWRPEPPNG